MSLTRRNFLLAVPAMHVAGFVSAQSATTSLAPLSTATAINRAGRLRALSQRTAKAAAQSALGVLPARASEILNTAHAIMQANLAELARANLQADVATLLPATRSEIEKLIAISAPARATRENLPDINRQAELVLRSAETLTAAVEKTSTAHTARIINIAGRQRLLSQRAAKAYMMGGANVDVNAMSKLRADSRLEFQNGLNTLNNFSVSNDKIRSELILVQSQWAFFSAALDLPFSVNGARDVATTSERILEVMDSLTNLYEAALKDVIG